jgi:two-component system, chemotaxis family, chemotaxis protein CheY
MILPQDLRALVVDDNAYARAAVAATLRKLGLVTIDELAGAAPAVGAIQATRYDIVFMDWYMPEMNGAALLEVIRDPRFSANGQVPVVMVTAYPNRETIARARELGAGEVLTKPFTVAHAAAALGRLLPDGWQIPDETEAGQVLL